MIVILFVMESACGVEAAVCSTCESAIFFFAGVDEGLSEITPLARLAEENNKKD